MMVPFHLHFYVPNPQETERRFLAILNMKTEARYGISGEGHRRFLPDEGWDVFTQGQSRFRFTHLVAGTFDVVLGASRRKEPVLEHFGLYVDEAAYERCKHMFQARGLAVQEGERRSFFTTPFGVRMELVAPHHGRGPQEHKNGLQLERLCFRVHHPASCRQFFADALGEVFSQYVDFEQGEATHQLDVSEVHLRSPFNADAVVEEILPGSRWYFRGTSE